MLCTCESLLFGRTRVRSTLEKGKHRQELCCAKADLPVCALVPAEHVGISTSRSSFTHSSAVVLCSAIGYMHIVVVEQRDWFSYFLIEILAGMKYRGLTELVTWNCHIVNRIYSTNKHLARSNLA